MQPNLYPMYYPMQYQPPRIQPQYRPIMQMEIPNPQQQFYHQYPFQYQTIPKRDFNQERFNRLNRLNRMKANTKQAKWTQEEEQLLEQKFEELGPHWSRMKYYFPGRTDVNLKNHWSSMMNRKKKEEVMKKISQTDGEIIENYHYEDYDRSHIDPSFESEAEPNIENHRVDVGQPPVMNQPESSSLTEPSPLDVLEDGFENDSNEAPGETQPGDSQIDFNDLYDDVDYLPTFSAIDL